VRVFEMRDFPAPSVLDVQGPVYISLDLDVLDPAFAPGISHYEPGGFSVRDVLNLIHQISNPIVGADVLEYNPTRDRNDQTAMVAAKFLKELAGQMVQNAS
jgi:arginase